MTARPDWADDFDGKYQVRKIKGLDLWTVDVKRDRGVFTSQVRNVTGNILGLLVVNQLRENDTRWQAWDATGQRRVGPSTRWRHQALRHLLADPLVSGGCNDDFT